MTTNSYEERMAEDFGPLARFSEYRRGDTIAYRLPNGAEVTGDVLWIVEPETSAKGTPLPTTYIVERTGAGNSFPDFVYQSQIKGLHGPLEPFIRES